jgi:hypothetical protein
MKTARLSAAMLWMVACVAGAAEPASADRPAQPGGNERASESSAAPQADASAERQEASAPDSAASSTRGARAGRTDRLDLDTTVVTGNRELPKVLYIVPWKKADLGDLPGQPFNTLLDETLAPVDRDVFRREVTYYGAISGEPDGAAMPSDAAPRASGGSEK